VSTFTVVTPCLNSEALIRRTAESLERQTAVRSGRLALQYLVCDGGSTDRTLAVVREVLGDRAEISSAPDGGMYDALAKGLRRASGDVISYLNAGDVYFDAAFDVVADVMESGRAEWLTGRAVTLNERGQVTNAWLPYRYRSEFIRKAMYATPLLPFFIQQESTFWSARLNSLVDLDALATFKLAGDYFLWKTFAREAELVVVDTFLGAFAFHPGQKSENAEAYEREAARLRERPGLLDLARAVVDRTVWLWGPQRLQRFLGRKSHLAYDRERSRWE
jgi:glycosyltransferase involved in cell wall biosynthesis